MVTFLPSRNFEECARVLDRQRLGKQRVEALTILRALLEGGSQLCHHPAARMWSQSLGKLLEYEIAVCKEWTARGYRDTCLDKACILFDAHPDVFFREIIEFDDGRIGFRPPTWWTDDEVFASHRATLLAKNPAHYEQFGWTEEPRLGYKWPVPTGTRR